MSPAAMPEHNSSYAMQKYIFLHSQHEELTQHLEQIRPPVRSNTWGSTTTTTNTSPVSTPILAPTGSSAFGPAPVSPRRHRSYASPPNVNISSTSSLDTVWDEETIYEVEAEQQRLSDVNEGIKRALTELLNCDVVRQDREFRMWVQCRLMETEKELRSGRRKRSVV